MTVSAWLLVAAASAAATDAQFGGERSDDRPKIVEAARLEGGIAVDGRIAEPAWAAAPVTDAFVQREPIEGAEPQTATQVRVLYDEQALYVAARMREPDPSTIARQLVRRDERGQADYFEVSLDPNDDDRTGYVFTVTAAGVQRDAYLYDDNREDASWDAVWQSAVAIDSLGWTVEMRIPLSQIRFQPSPLPQDWGIDFTRYRVAAAERTDFALLSRRRHGRVSMFGTLEALRLPEAPGRLELRPYALARLRTAPAEPDDPFFDGAERDLGVGGDLRFGLGGAFALDATVNPDFGQVEVDPAVINLTAFETFFPEKRPFFVEDARVFDFGLSGRENSLFYSRRIGRVPRGTAPAGAAYADSPDESSILGAAKLTGRTPGGLSIGVLAAATEREEGRAFLPAGDSVAAFLAEPRAGFGVLRAQQDLRGGRGFVGGILTAMARDLPETGPLARLSSEAFSAGLDFEHTWRDREWALTGFLAGSLVRGSPEALVAVQRSSNHYFQRPDADYLEVDSAATSLTGAEWRLQFERRSGRHWTGAVWAAQRTPGFEVNDLGFSNGNERLDAGARIGYSEITPGDVLRSYRLNLFSFHNWRHSALDDPLSYDAWAHAHKAGAAWLSADLTFLNYWSLDLNARYGPEVLDDRLTRGGPLMLDPSERSISLRASTDRRRPIALAPSVERAWRGDAGSSWSAGLQLTVRPSPRLLVEMRPRYSEETDARQYVAATPDVGFSPTFGRRYLFADLERRSVSLETRLDVTFTPTLTLQLFAQPLLSAGDYAAYKQLAAAETFDFLRFEPGTTVEGDEGPRCVGGSICARGERRLVDFDGDAEPDFAFRDGDFRVRSLRGNAVLRWEWRPGSTLFLVWQQSRFLRDADVEEFRALAAAPELFDLPPENVLIVKASYWLGL